MQRLAFALSALAIAALSVAAIKISIESSQTTDDPQRIGQSRSPISQDIPIPSIKAQLSDNDSTTLILPAADGQTISAFGTGGVSNFPASDSPPGLARIGSQPQLSWMTRLTAHISTLAGRGGGDSRRLNSIAQLAPTVVSFHTSDVLSLNPNNSTAAAFNGLVLEYLDANTISLLTGFRRITDDEISSDSEVKAPAYNLEVAPGGGRYWIEDPEAAWW